MALRKTWTVQAGTMIKASMLGVAASQIASKFVPLAQDFVVEDAYIKIANIHGDKNGMLLKYSVIVGANAIDDGYTSFVPFLQGNNFIAQGYDHLKTLPEFAGATDC
jgi:hypothetical protein